MQSTLTMNGLLAEDQGSVKSEDSITGRAKFLCSYGGRIIPRPQDSQLRYVGGETRILTVNRGISLGDLMAKVMKLCSNESVSLKYQLPNEDLDALVSVITEEDLENMMEEYDRIDSKDSSSRLRLFVFPASLKQRKGDLQDHHVDPEHRFVDAVNGLLRNIDPISTQVPVSLAEGQQKHGNILSVQPAAAVERQQAAPYSHVPCILVSGLPPISSQVSGASGALQVPAASGTSGPSQISTPSIVPQVLGAPSLVPSQVLAAAAAPLVPNVVPPPLVPSQVLAAPAAATNGALVAPMAPMVLAAPGNPPLVRLAPPGVPAVMPVVPPPQVVAARSVMPQVVTSKPLLPPTYVPLVDVSRGLLPNGMVLRQCSVEDDHLDTLPSQSAQFSEVVPASVAVTVAKPELINLDGRDAGKLLNDRSTLVEKRLMLPKPQEGTVFQHVADSKNTLADNQNQKFNAQVHNQLIAGGQTKVAETQLERYLKEQTMGDASEVGIHYYIHNPGPLQWKLHEQQQQQPPIDTIDATSGLPAPDLQSVDMPMLAARPQLNRQFSDRSAEQQYHQENRLPNARPGGLGRDKVPGVVRVVHQVPEVIVQMDEGVPKSVLDGLRQQQQQQQQPLLHPEQVGHVPHFVEKVVPQVVGVNPFKVP